MKKHPWLTWLGASAVVRLLVRLRVEGGQTIPAPPAVVVCNHQSWLDPLLIIVALGPRRRVVFLAAREHVEKRPVLAALVRWLGGAILVDRASIHQRDTLRASAAALGAGCYLALFPEGRINTTAHALQPLEPGATAIARRAGAPLVPLGIAGARELHFRRRIRLRIGAPVSPATKHHGDDAVTEQLHAALLTTLPPTPALARWQPGKWLGRLT
jgi:1-acyl-sn-glycerol-3-phosphate acyltransferase